MIPKCCAACPKAIQIRTERQSIELYADCKPLFTTTTFFRVGPYLSNASCHNPRMKTANQFMQTIPIQVPGHHQFTLPIHQVPKRPPNAVLTINDALQIKAAEYWRKLGE